MLGNFFSSDDITHEPTVDYNRTFNREWASRIDVPDQKLPGGFSRLKTEPLSHTVPDASAAHAALDLDDEIDVLMKLAADRVRNNNTFLKRLDLAIDCASADAAIDGSNQEQRLTDLQKRYDQLRDDLLREHELYTEFYKGYKELLLKHNALLKQGTSHTASIANKVNEIKSASDQIKVKQLCDALLDELNNAHSR